MWLPPFPAVCTCVSSAPPATVDEEPDEGDLEEHEEVSYSANQCVLVSNSSNAHHVVDSIFATVLHK